MRDLGVVFDVKMAHGNQIEPVVNKCLRTLGLIKNVSCYFRSALTLVKLYKSLLLPILTFIFSYGRYCGYQYKSYSI